MTITFAGVVSDAHDIVIMMDATSELKPGDSFAFLVKGMSQAAFSHIHFETTFCPCYGYSCEYTGLMDYYVVEVKRLIACPLKLMRVIMNGEYQTA